MTLLIKRTAITLLFITSGLIVQAQRRITGKVMDRDSTKPLEGVIVNNAVSGMAMATTDRNGTFSIETADSLLRLDIRHLGYTHRTVVADAAVRDTLFIELLPNNVQLEEVVISTGYQDVNTTIATGSYASVSKQALERQVSTGILSRLEGRVNALQFDKRFPSETNLNFRGRSTILADNNPLIILDNFPYEGDLNSINPNDIEHVTVLKDAVAASIWGARAGNGVIVITTKKPDFSDATSISFHNNISVGQKPNLYYNPGYIGASDFIALEKHLFDLGHYTAVENSPAKPPLSPVVELLIQHRDGTLTIGEVNEHLAEMENYDFRSDVRKYVFQNSVNRQHSLRVNGGTQRFNYLLSAGLDDNADDLIRNGLQRITLNSNLNAKLSNRLAVGINLYYSLQRRAANNPGMAQLSVSGTQSQYPYSRLVDDAGHYLTLPKDYRDTYKEDQEKNGFLYWGFSPLDEINLSDNRSHIRNILINGSFKYTVLADLSATLGYQFRRQTNEGRFNRSVEQYYVRNLINRYTSSVLTSAIPMGGILDLNLATLNGYSIRPQLNYDKTISNHLISAIGGYEISHSQSEEFSHRLYGFDEDTYSFFPNIDYTERYPMTPTGSAQIPNPMNLNGRVDRFISIYLNAQYSYDSRYMFSLSARRDASNLFGVKTNQRGVPLWSVGAGWNLHDESFFTGMPLDILRFRVTHGYQGNINKSTSAYTVARYATDGITGLRNAVIESPPNPQLRWERVAMTNVGIDFSVKNRLFSGKVEYYKKRGTDLFGYVDINPTAGFFISNRYNVLLNSAEVVTDGIDIEVTSSVTKGRFAWISGLMVGLNKDRVVRYDYETILNNRFLDANPPVAGKPRFGVYSYKWAGLSPETGDPQFLLGNQVTGDYSKITREASEDDLIFHGPSLPVFNGAFNTTLSWAGISLSFVFRFSGGNYFRRESISYTQLFNSNSGHIDFSKRWLKSGDEVHTNVPSMPTIADANRDRIYSNSSILVERADNLRLQDINLSYALDTRYFRELRIYAYANNIGMIWKANKHSLDPEYLRHEFIPPRTFSLGLSLSL